MESPDERIHEHGYPLRGIISGRGGPTERLASFVDFFLQPGMKQLPSFLQDTKHVLQIIDEINQNIEAGEVSLDGVALVTLDVEAMYNNMTDELAGILYISISKTKGNPRKLGGVSRRNLESLRNSKILDH